LAGGLVVARRAEGADLLGEGVDRARSSSRSPDELALAGVEVEHPSMGASPARGGDQAGAHGVEVGPEAADVEHGER
jgi:hypothetical protein